MRTSKTKIRREKRIEKIEIALWLVMVLGWSYLIMISVSGIIESVIG